MSWLPLGCFFSLSLLLIHCGTPGFPLPRLSVNITLYLKHNPLLLLPLLYFFYFIIEHLQHFDNIIIRARVLAVTADLCHPGQPCFLSSPLYQPFSPFFTFFHLFTFLSLQFLICIYLPLHPYTLTLYPFYPVFSLPHPFFCQWLCRGSIIGSIPRDEIERDLTFLN